LRFPICASRSTTTWFAFLFSGEKRGTPARKSVLSKVVFFVNFPCKETFAQRAERNEANAKFFSVGMISASGSRHQLSIRFAKPLPAARHERDEWFAHQPPTYRNVSLFLHGSDL